MGIVIHRRITPKPGHRPRGDLRHYREEREIPDSMAQEIARYAGDPGISLFYLDVAGDLIADTCHESLEGALSRVEPEFGVGEDRWLVPEEES